MVNVQQYILLDANYFVSFFLSLVPFSSVHRVIFFFFVLVFCFVSAGVSDEAIARGEGGEFQISIHLEQENTELRSKLPSEYKGLKVRVILMQGMQPDPDVMGNYTDEF